MTSISAASLADPPSSSAVTAAGTWVQSALTGSLAVSIAVIVVASVGLLMLAGRIDMRRGLSVLIGCFVLFGAPVIAAALSGVERTAATASVLSMPADVRIPQRPSQPASRPDTYDPYAGASVPR